MARRPIAASPTPVPINHKGTRPVVPRFAIIKFFCLSERLLLINFVQKKSLDPPRIRMHLTGESMLGLLFSPGDKKILSLATWSSPHPSPRISSIVVGDLIRIDYLASSDKIKKGVRVLTLPTNKFAGFLGLRLWALASLNISAR
jgi:hypothetical protein